MYLKGYVLIHVQHIDSFFSLDESYFYFATLSSFLLSRGQNRETKSGWGKKKGCRTEIRKGERGRKNMFLCCSTRPIGGAQLQERKIKIRWEFPLSRKPSWRFLQVARSLFYVFYFLLDRTLHLWIQMNFAKLSYVFFSLSLPVPVPCECISVFLLFLLCPLSHGRHEHGRSWGGDALIRMANAAHVTVRMLRGPRRLHFRWHSCEKKTTWLATKLMIKWWFATCWQF